MGPKRYAVQCIVSGEENPQNCPFPWDFVILPEEDRATAIGNIHKKLFGKIARVVPEIYPRKQTDIHIQTYSSEYFKAAPAGELITVDKRT